MAVELPTKVSIVSSKYTYAVGEKASFQCFSYNSNPTALISWTMDDKSISSPQHKSGKPSSDIINDFLKDIQAHGDIYGGLGSDEFLKPKASSLQLNFRVNKKHLKNGIKIGCRAHIGDLYVPQSIAIDVTQATGGVKSSNFYSRYVGMALVFTFMLN